MTRLARELHKTIEEIELIPGDELDRWRDHFSREPFTWQLLDIHLAKLRWALERTMGGSKQKIEKYLLIEYRKPKMTAEQMMISMNGKPGGGESLL